MKEFNINCRIDGKYRVVTDYIKLNKKSLTKFIEEKFQEVLDTIPENELELLKSVRQIGEK